MRNIEDKDYLECLPSDIYRRNYGRWKKRMLDRIETIVETFRVKGVDKAIQELDMTPRDVMLLTKLGYLTPEEIEEFGLTNVLSMDVL